MSSPEPSRNAIVFCVNAAYLPFALFTAWRIRTLSMPGEFDILIAGNDELTIPESCAWLDIQYLHIEPDSALQGLKTVYLPLETYLRLWVPERLAGRYDRVLYIDADVLPERSGIGELFAADLGSYTVAGVRDFLQWLKPGTHFEDMKAFGLPRKPYFNCGIMLIDVNRFNDGNVKERCLELSAQKPEAVLHQDQSLLNAVLIDEWGELSPLWNWQLPRHAPLLGETFGARFTHFVGRVKPWNDPQGLFPRRYAAAYLDFFEQYGLRPNSVRETGVDTFSLAAYAKSMVKQALRRKSVTSYLQRFPTDYTILPPG